MREAALFRLLLRATSASESVYISSVSEAEAAARVD